jgi:PDZ domain
VLHRILPTRASEGYAGEGSLVLSINGVAIRNLQHLRDLAGERIRSGRELALGLEGGRLLALAPEELKEADREVRERHGIRYLEGGLDDLRAP